MADAPARRPRGRLRRGLSALRTRVTPGSVRARATLAACTVVAVALTVASLAMLSLLRADLRGNAEASARVQAGTVVKLAMGGRLGKVVPLGYDTDFVQVVNGKGVVVAASQNIAGRPALPLVPNPVVEVPGLKPFGIEARQQITSVVTETPEGPVIIRTGVSLMAADDAVHTTALTLVVGCPLLLLTVALVTWRVTGRALRPVEAIRSEVAAIGEQELHRRVPVPRGEDEITRLARTMNGMLDRLDLAGRRQRQFIADASHELRSPIAVLRTQLEVALGHPDPQVRVELVEGALQDAERLQDLAADLLFLARLDAGPAARPDDPVELAELVRAAARGRDVTLDLDREALVPGHRLWLTRLVTNLLDNAERHARTEVLVGLRVDRTTGWAVLEVHNDGEPLAPADRERIFERFTRLDDARSRDAGGAGLGLPIARDIAQHHGGTLTVVDAPTGATFRVRLPVLTAQAGSR
ncbi:HAMP domain-containing sensor histidine kinase [Streptacidiphilus jiangxiensis]|uniref:histidine kinase n=1 Tax=Streptacidiphilus jiangxiensis TaxID=235985 RepID=A0A1H7IA67_STRJI|nr:ATP-binding protein [Streptacidiphilus jiangxiensis]SEK58410.1 Signal transduction histidine kinase [Streptacidiphilus jiangxiensis]